MDDLGVLKFKRNFGSGIKVGDAVIGLMGVEHGKRVELVIIAPKQVKIDRISVEDLSEIFNDLTKIKEDYSHNRDK